MSFKQFLAIAAFCLPALIISAQPQKAPENWFTKDLTADGVQGTSSDQALKALQAKGKQGKPIIVAVLDSGIEVDHEDLKDIIWTNPGEIAGNGKDDDNNGYIDDIHGWNFLGGKDGKNINHEQLELTREYVRLTKRFKDTPDPKKLPANVQKEYAYYEEIKKAYEDELKGVQDQKQQTDAFFGQVKEAIKTVKTAQGITGMLSADDVKAAEGSSQDDVKKAAGLLSKMYKQGLTEESLEEQIKSADEYFGGQLNYNLNKDYNPRTIVGDDPNDLTNRNYGNNDYEGPDAFHGTHVAGIIAAKRGNNLGIDGIAINVQIMSVRCVPDGDERDKDVANAIYYAVDNGASIINMSFGKGYSPDKAYVDAAMKYAADHDVLLVHAAGNDAADNDTDSNFPNDDYATAYKAGLFKKQKNVPTWMEIGALNWKTGDKKVASFSNYGKKNVDLFSPGVALKSTVPDGKYGEASGTSMASPAAAGVAAIIRSYYPDLSAQQVKEVLMGSVSKVDGDVIKPGTKDEKVPFSSLSASGGVISTTKAVELAEKTKGKKGPKKAIWREAGEGKMKGKKEKVATP